MRTAAILPVKRFSQAKQRLRASVGDQLRMKLVRAMVGDVLDALSETEAIQLTIVVTREQAVTESALVAQALIVQDAERGQSAAVGVGIEHAIAAGAQRVLCIPGDCPALDPHELSALLAPHPQQADEVVIVPDRHGSGTNGLLLSPPRAIAPSFGPRSCERHRELAVQAGVPCRLARPSSLLLDVDTGADLTALSQQLSGFGDRASRTRAALETIDEQAWATSHSAA
jgi:2-phospho-L-lactate/phosphoenolpyruvate guanylyltransferase